MHEKLPAPAKCTCIEAHHLSVVISSLPVEKAEVHETISDSNGGYTKAFFTDSYSCIFGIEKGLKIVRESRF